MQQVMISFAPGICACSCGRPGEENTQRPTQQIEPALECWHNMLEGRQNRMHQAKDLHNQVAAAKSSHKSGEPDSLSSYQQEC